MEEGTYQETLICQQRYLKEAGQSAVGSGVAARRKVREARSRSVGLHYTTAINYDLG